MSRHTREIITATILFCLLSASQADEGFYVPIHNLAPISYNPLTTNYNPDYDYYPGLMAKQSQESNQGGSSSTASVANAKSSQIAEIQSQIAELKKQRNLPENDWSKVPMKDMFTAASRSRQINTDIQNLEDRLTTLTTGQAPVRVVNQTAPRRSINCYTYGLGNAFTTCN
ncbi:hypothetical protein G7048_06165 [Diaphorobacter sp. HDW4B]|uniref:hypothetical protein n=1 Tax=Diaphorobacter sp. HDW4B TaxID=2714925 RepID=UPI00140CE4CB|nr:hypothetical protein [Diaphorobacter sp. HDW4B]QIL69979.1 hypothetical protein G7048_06165 [Diaphorobacter sp. HDW4B]